MIGHDHEHTAEALADTREALAADDAPALFEAAFEHEGVFCRADVLERLAGGGWRLVEVKSTVNLKEVLVQDVAVQLWVLRGAGLDVRDAGVLTLNGDYVYDGVRLDVHALFRLHPVFHKALALRSPMAEPLKRARRNAAVSGIDSIFDEYVQWIEDVMTTEERPWVSVVCVLVG